MASKTTIVFGPPGTGKTTRLMSLVESLLQAHVSPNDICFVAFTRKAANEAKWRAMQQFGLSEDQIPWFRTLHSLAYRQLGIQKENILGYRDYQTIANRLGLTITFRGGFEDGTIAGFSKGDRLFFTEMMSRARCIDLKQVWEERPDEDINWWELERLAKTLADFKRIRNKVDYTDIIHMFVSDEHTNIPDFQAVFVDEAQDLTPIQWRMAEKLMSHSQEVYIAGDDDQAIFKWAGADVDYFQNLEGDRVVLPQSFRVPELIMAEAMKVASRISQRVEKVWRPRKEQGGIHWVTGVDQIDMSQGSWLLLARNVYLTEEYRSHCLREGFVFDSIGGSPIRGASFRAIKTWESLRKGNPEFARDIKALYDLMTVREQVAYGYKARLDRVEDNERLTITDLRQNYGLQTDDIWHKSLSKLSPEEVEYFIAALRRGEKPSREPRIKINTIHGVKGGEADSVVLQLDMAQRTYSEYQENPDDEHRVWYVAITRARQNLYIIQPRTNRAYDL